MTKKIKKLQRIGKKTDEPMVGIFSPEPAVAMAQAKELEEVTEAAIDRQDTKRWRVLNRDLGKLSPSEIEARYGSANVVQRNWRDFYPFAPVTPPEETKMKEEPSSLIDGLRVIIREEIQGIKNIDEQTASKRFKFTSELHDRLKQVRSRDGYEFANVADLVKYLRGQADSIEREG